jgi:hypothetical protein
MRLANISENNLLVLETSLYEVNSLKDKLGNRLEADVRSFEVKTFYSVLRLYAGLMATHASRRFPSQS